MAKITISELLKFFEDSPDFHVLHKSKQYKTPHLTFDIKTDYFNPIRPNNIHVIGDYELAYINSLTESEQTNLINRLIHSGAIAFVFNKTDSIPSLFTSQSRISVIHSIQSLEQIRNNIINNFSNTTVHGCFVVVYNQGILITGESGIGKSTLLLSLLDNGHMWVADDAPSFTLNDKKEIIGHAAHQLESFIHIKNVGIINMDNEYGRSSQLKQHKLSAIIHLTKTSHNQKEQSLEFDPLKFEELLGIKLPKWTLNVDSKSLVLLIEKCTHQLVLDNWGISNSTILDDKLNHLLK